VTVKKGKYLQEVGVIVHRDTFNDCITRRYCQRGCVKQDKRNNKWPRHIAADLQQYGNSAAILQQHGRNNICTCNIFIFLEKEEVFCCISAKHYKGGTAFIIPYFAAFRMSVD
jgi:hypothetical protein